MDFNLSFHRFLYFLPSNSICQQPAYTYTIYAKEKAKHLQYYFLVALMFFLTLSNVAMV